MVRKEQKIIPMTFDENFYRRMADQKYKQRSYGKAAEHYGDMPDLSPEDFDIKLKCADCLDELNLNKKAEKMFYEGTVNDHNVSESYYQLSQLNIELNEPNKAFLFGINYVVLSNDDSSREELENMFEVSYIEENKIEVEAQLSVVQLLFQYLFAQGRLQEARTYALKQNDDTQSHRVTRSLLAMCYLYLSEYEIAKELFETLFTEDSSDVHALCHYTLLLYNTNEIKKYHKYVKILDKVIPMNEDESFKLGIVLSYLEQYKASQQLLLPLYKRGKFVSVQIFNVLSYNYYYLGSKEQSKLFWDKLLQVSEVNAGYAPWVLEESKYTFEQKILPSLLDDDSRYRLYDVFLLNQLNGKEVLMTEDIWSVLENMNDYEKLYLTYLVQGLHLNKLDFIHKGLKKIYDVEELSFDTELFVSWIGKGETLIVEGANFKELNRCIAAHVYLYYRYHKKHITRKKIIEILNTTRYKLGNVIDKLLSI